MQGPEAYREYTDRCTKLAELSKLPEISRRLRALALQYKAREVEAQCEVMKSPPLIPEDALEDQYSPVSGARD